MASSLMKAYVTIGAKLEPLKRALAKAKAAVKKAVEKMNAAFSKLGRTIKKVGIAIVALGIASTYAFVKFEKGLANVAHYVKQAND